MKQILLVIDALESFRKRAVTRQAEEQLDKLLEADCFDCVISSICQTLSDSSTVCFAGREILSPEARQTVTAAVAAHAQHFAERSTCSAYSEALITLLKKENNGALPPWVYVVGFDMEGSVLMTAADLFTHGIRPIVLTACCGSFGGDATKLAAMRVLDSLVGADNMYHGTVRTAADLKRIAESTEQAEVSTKAQLLVDRLFQKGWRISFAESCTGGKAAAGIVDVASASTVFDAAFVTYANEAKIAFLGVSPETIRQHGVVSEPVATEMATGAAKKAAAQVGVGISGIAGPGGGTEAKPVGMVCFGFYIDGVTYSKTVQFGAIGRNAVRQASVDYVYTTLLDLLR